MQINQKEQNSLSSIKEQSLQPNQTQKNGSQQKGNQHEGFIKKLKDQVQKTKNLIQNKLNKQIENLNRQSLSKFKYFSRFFQMLSELEKFNQRIKPYIARKQFVKHLKQLCKTISQEEKELITELKINLIYLDLLQKEQILRHLFIAFPKLQTIIQNYWDEESKHQRKDTKLDLDDENKIQQQNNLRYAKQLRQIIEKYLKRKKYQRNYYEDNFLEILSKTNEQIRSLVTQLDIIDLMYSSLTNMEIVQLCKLLPNLRSQKMKKFQQFKKLMLKEYPFLNCLIKSEQILLQSFMKTSKYISYNNQNSQLLDISSGQSLNLQLQNDLLDNFTEYEKKLVCFLTKKYLQTLKIKQQSQQTLSKSLEKFKGQLQQFEKKFKKQNHINIKIKYYSYKIKLLELYSQILKIKKKFYIYIKRKNSEKTQYFYYKIEEIEQLKSHVQEMCQNFNPNNQLYQLKEIEVKEKEKLLNQEFQSLQRKIQDLKKQMEIYFHESWKKQQTEQDFIQNYFDEEKQGHGSPQFFQEIKSMNVQIEHNQQVLNSQPILDGIDSALEQAAQ